MAELTLHGAGDAYCHDISVVHGRVDEFAPSANAAKNAWDVKMRIVNRNVTRDD
jgi:hypothetical protein